MIVNVVSWSGIGDFRHTLPRQFSRRGRDTDIVILRAKSNVSLLKVSKYILCFVYISVILLGDRSENGGKGFKVSIVLDSHMCHVLLSSAEHLGSGC